MSKKKPMSRPLKLVVWIGGGIVGLFIIVMAIGAIGVASQPGGWEAAMQEQKDDQSAKNSQKASLEAAAAESDEQVELDRKAEEKKNAAQESKKAAAAEVQKDAEAKKNAAQESKKAAAAEVQKDAEAKKVKKAADAEKAKAEAEAEAVEKKAAQKSKAAAEAKKKKKADDQKKAKAEAAAHPFKATEVAADVDGLKVHKEGAVLFAAFPVKDNLTQGMIRTGAQLDTVAILKAIRGNAKGYDKVFVQGSFPMQDQYGNDSNSMILNAGYEKSTLGKINYDGIDHSKIWDIRDNGMVHPELQ